MTDTQVILAVDRPVWDRQPGEKAHWYFKFEYFLKLGPNRNIEQAFQKWLREYKKLDADKPARKFTRATSTWYAVATRWLWTDRAEAWDDHQRELLKYVEEEEAQVWRVKRRELIEKFFDKVLITIDKIQVDEVDLPQLTQAVQATTRELRMEFDQAEQTLFPMLQPTELEEGDRILTVEELSLRVLAITERARQRRITVISKEDGKGV